MDDDEPLDDRPFAAEPTASAPFTSSEPATAAAAAGTASRTFTRRTLFPWKRKSLDHELVTKVAGPNPSEAERKRLFEDIDDIDTFVRNSKFHAVRRRGSIPNEFIMKLLFGPGYTLKAPHNHKGPNICKDPQYEKLFDFDKRYLEHGIAMPFTDYERECLTAIDITTGLVARMRHTGVTKTTRSVFADRRQMMMHIGGGLLAIAGMNYDTILTYIREKMQGGLDSEYQSIISDAYGRALENGYASDHTRVMGDAFTQLKEKAVTDLETLANTGGLTSEQVRQVMDEAFAEIYERNDPAAATQLFMDKLRQSTMEGLERDGPSIGDIAGRVAKVLSTVALIYYIAKPVLQGVDMHEDYCQAVLEEVDPICRLKMGIGSVPERTWDEAALRKDMLELLRTVLHGEVLPELQEMADEVAENAAARMQGIKLIPSGENALSDTDDDTPDPDAPDPQPPAPTTSLKPKAGETTVVGTVADKPQEPIKAA